MLHVQFMFRGIGCVRTCRFAFYAVVVGVVYIVGLPVTVFVILYRRRHKLFGSATDPFVATTRTTFGFLYEVRGNTSGR